MKFEGRIIVLDAEKITKHCIEWHPYSPDLNSFYFFLWGYIKDRINRKPTDLLKSYIKSEFDVLNSNTLQSFMA